MASKPPVGPEPKKLSNITLTESVTLLNYAAPGNGKTHLAGSAGSRNLIFTDLNGMVTLKNPVFLSQFPGCDPWVEEIPRDMDLASAKAYDYMADRINYWFENHMDKFDVVTIDDADQLRAASLVRAVATNKAEGKSETGTKIGKYKIIMPAIQDFGTEMGYVEGFIANLISHCKIYNKHLIVNAHEKIIYNKDGGPNKEPTVKKIVPDFTGKASPEAILDYFDLVFRITRVGKHPSATLRYQCHPDEMHAAKDRYSVFKTYEDKLTFPAILKRIHDNIPENTIVEEE